MARGEREKRDQLKSFQRRSVLLFGAQVGLAGLLGARLYQLQVVESADYQVLAEDNRIKIELLAPRRGEIFARGGEPLAINRHNYTVWLVEEQAGDLETVITRLRRIAPLSQRELRILARRLQRAPSFVPVAVTDNLSWEEFAALNANAPALPGVEARVEWAREYPEGETFAHVVGYVAAVNDRDLERDRTRDPLLRLPNARIGKSGVEQAAELDLRGSGGERRIEVNASGREIRELVRDEGASGDDLTLTVDLELQRYAMARLAGESAAAVVMDVWTGDVLAFASAPAYDPNKFVFGISQRDWDALLNDEYLPLLNKAATGLYPPGSTFKMLTAIAALESGEITPETTFTCEGKIFFGDRDFHCWKRSGHGVMNMIDGIKNSCDVYFYEIAKAAGIDRIADVSARFGVGVRPEIAMPNLKGGTLPTRDWMFAQQGRGWSGGDTLNVGIGQGALEMTPLQLAVMTARIGNGGARVRPRLVRAVNGVERPPEPFEPLGVAPDHMRLVRQGMNAVSNEEGGTAYRARIVDPENMLAGKTGTAQVRGISVEERERGLRENDELPWSLRDHALFVAYAPVAAPRYAISVFVEHGGGGSTTAAPIARDIMIRALYGPQPDLETYPPEVRRQIDAAREAVEKAQGAPEQALGPGFFGRG